MRSWRPPFTPDRKPSANACTATLKACGLTLLGRIGVLIDGLVDNDLFDNSLIDDSFMPDPLRVLRGVQFAGRFAMLPPMFTGLWAGGIVVPDQ